MPRTRMYSFALAAVAVGALTAGCASGSGDSSSVELEIWNPETDDASIAVFQSMVDAYEEQNPGVTVNLVNIPWSDIFTKWQTALQSGNAPDATIGSAAFATSFQEQGVLEPLDDVVAQIGGEEAWSDTADSLVEMSKADGSYFALPYTNNAVLLWYNKAMFESEGLKPPTTWDELRDAAETLTHDDQYGILVPPPRAWSPHRACTA